MEEKELYARYGELQIQAEIINGQILEVKNQIAQKITKRQELTRKENSKNLKKESS